MWIYVTVAKNANEFVRLERLKLFKLNKIRYMKRCTKGVPVFGIGRLLIFALEVALVMWLWNLLVPGIIGWSTINYWQALGLMVLFRFLCSFPMLSLSQRFFYHGFENDCFTSRHRHFHERMRGMSREERKAYIRSHIRDLSDKEE